MSGAQAGLHLFFSKTGSSSSVDACYVTSRADLAMLVPLFPVGDARYPAGSGWEWLVADTPAFLICVMNQIWKSDGEVQDSVPP